MSRREDILDLLSGKRMGNKPVFSGLIHVITEGFERDRLSLHEVHHDAGKMAKAAASTFKLTGMPSATLPLDLCAPAEALGAELNFYEGGEMQFPQVKKFTIESTKEIERLETGELATGRIRMVCDAIGLDRDDIGKDVVISGLLPGPYTLLLYLCNPMNLFVEMKKEPQSVMDALFHLSSFLSKIGQAYRNAGADFITIHDMGGSAGFIGPSKYEQFVFPAEKHLIEQLSKPCVLSVCGKMDKSLHLLVQTGASAVSVDQLTDLKAAREALKDTLLFGNIDPVETLLRGDEAGVVEAVQRSKEAGVDAVWPGCDIVPSTPIQNIKAMMA
jgi:[methyl-Co(III) methanol-specific corrinoid protein]:coenzyme M methyltransferase